MLSKIKVDTLCLIFDGNTSRNHCKPRMFNCNIHLRSPSGHTRALFRKKATAEAVHCWKVKLAKAASIFWDERLSSDFNGAPLKSIDAHIICIHT